MRVVGFNLQKNQIRLTVLEGTKENPVLVHSQKLITQTNSDQPSRMNWYRDSFERTINAYAVDTVAYRLSLISATMDQVHNFYYPYGVLNDICFQKNLTSIEFSSKKLKYPKTVGHPQGSDLYLLCDEKIGPLCVRDKSQKESAITAWFALGESNA